MAFAMPNPAYAQTESRAGVTSYAPEFFSRVQPTTAYDMLILLPGFRLVEGDAEIRGYSGSGGNVLVDGQRPSGKEDTLENVLKRIPASRVERIELIRAGSAGVDMQGYPLIANVVRNSGGNLTGRLEGEFASFDHGYTAPRVAGELSYGGEARRLDLTGAIYREIDDEHGFGSRNRYDANGDPIRLSNYEQPEGTDIREATVNYRQPLAGGTIRLNGLWKQERMFAHIKDNIFFPAPDLIIGEERNATDIIEGGLQYKRPLGVASSMELLGSYRQSKLDGSETSTSGEEDERTIGLSDESETILRGVFRHNAGFVSIETGAEGAINILDGRNSLFENGDRVNLPNAVVRVEEKRAEFFGIATWTLSPAFTLETAARYEISRLSQTGDSSLSKSLSFFKPRALLTWKASPRDQIRLLVEREVGQLDFADFIGAASLTTGVVTAGNRDLEPDSLWRFEAAIEHGFGSGSIVLTARHEEISDVVDQIPVSIDGDVFDAVGNIGRGKRDELEFNLNLPLNLVSLGVTTIKADAVLRRSRVTDPTTGERRRISEDVPIEAAISLTQDMPRWNLRAGANYAVSERESDYKVFEVQTDKLEGRLDIFVEYKPSALWTVRIFGKNLTDSASIRTRETYTGLRGSSPLKFLEKRILNSGPYVGVTIQRNFGA